MSSYNKWIKNVQQDRNDKANWRCNVNEENDLAAAKNPPQFPFVTLFQNDLVEKYAVQMSSEPTGNYSRRALRSCAQVVRSRRALKACAQGVRSRRALKACT